MNLKNYVTKRLPKDAYVTGIKCIAMTGPFGGNQGLTFRVKYQLPGDAMVLYQDFDEPEVMALMFADLMEIELVNVRRSS